MARMVKCLLDQHESLRSDPQHPHRKHLQWNTPLISVLRRVRQVDLRAGGLEECSGMLSSGCGMAIALTKS